MSWVCLWDMNGGPLAADDMEELDKLKMVHDEEELDVAGGAGTFWKGAGQPASHPIIYNCQRWLMAVERQQNQ